ncbi:hypothetical protein FGO68_gene17627 [Halteria grandinella]|uniref:Uncharacterized protein n=1 Tax=Halteria grandinella TaxID=5974 RepID=A0A8J8T1J5_HALGN|nr:hypothetical protein FGO68_gene17627 [Halteria grandinella]
MADVLNSAAKLDTLNKSTVTLDNVRNSYQLNNSRNEPSKFKTARPFTTMGAGSSRNVRDMISVSSQSKRSLACQPIQASHTILANANKTQTSFDTKSTSAVTLTLNSRSSILHSRDGANKQLNHSTIDIPSRNTNDFDAPAKSEDRTAAKKKWGVDGYYVPDNNWMFDRIKTFWSKSKKENIIEYEARKKKEVPAPGMYTKIEDWSQNSKGRFTKSKRCTLIDQILAHKKQIGPGTYELPKYRIKGFVKQNTLKGQFIGEALFMGKETPGSKYNINYQSIEGKVPIARLMQPVDPKRAKSAETGIRPKKTKQPAPGSYDIAEAFRRSQFPHTNVLLITKPKPGRNGDFLEQLTRAKSAIPGVGKYKETERGYFILSKPPTSLKRRR